MQMPYKVSSGPYGYASTDYMLLRRTKEGGKKDPFFNVESSPLKKNGSASAKMHSDSLQARGIQAHVRHRPRDWNVGRGSFQGDRRVCGVGGL
ncbi:hypothetical protein L249_0353 [Ophiocordyceps polyrhachis-furcata BCC 54312]|uniref:Uncharacterized protein n=1 Tax=Ophiocordyceps polyrhachis-furcata BCC 54312 TaxID=1330021 RepID=A0A367LDK4_9HYPO|nr:hypothetical protein L249_0353 [Ophiocordyceps polyrhachis-furcata BCC 54312]